MVSLAACGSGDCFNPPCPLPVAIVVTVKSATTDTLLTAAALSVAGEIVSSERCGRGQCPVPGGAGTYTLTISAPEFQSLQQTLTVSGSSAACGCGSVATKQDTVALSPM